MGVAPVRVFGQKVGVEISVPDIVVRERREGVRKAVLENDECRAGMFRFYPWVSRDGSQESAEEQSGRLC